MGQKETPVDSGETQVTLQKKSALGVSAISHQPPAPASLAIQDCPPEAQGSEGSALSQVPLGALWNFSKPQ